MPPSKNAHWDDPSLPAYRRPSKPRQHSYRRTVDCETCGESFQASRSDARFCSGACRMQSYMDRRRMSGLEGFTPEQRDYIIEMEKRAPFAADQIKTARRDLGLGAGRYALRAVALWIRETSPKQDKPNEPPKNPILKMLRK